MNNLPEEYVVVVRSKEQFNEVLKYFIKDEIHDKSYHYDSYNPSKGKSEYFLAKTINNWSYNDTNLYNGKVYSFIKWKQVIESIPEYWYVVVTEENQKVLSDWRRFNETVYSLLPIGAVVGRHDWGHSASKEVDRRDHDDTFNKYWKNEITFEQFKQHILKQKNTMKQGFTVEGSKILKEAFIKQLIEEGIDDVLGGYENGELCEGLNPYIAPKGVEAIAVQVGLAKSKQPNHYILPQDWNIALKAFTQYYKPEFKVGDYVTLNEEGLRFLAGVNDSNYFGGLFQIDKVSDQYLYPKNRVLGIHQDKKYFRLATEEEIQNSKDIIQIMTSDKDTFELIVRKGSVFYAPDNYTFNSTDINELKRFIAQTNRVGEYKFQPTSFSWGCKTNISLSSIEALLDTWKSLNG